MSSLSVKIIVESTGKTFDTLKDWGLAIGNTNYIGDPVLETFYETVSGLSKTLDLSEVLTGKPVYKSRPINVLLGGKKNRRDWDGFISEYRNEIEGQVVRLTFSNDLAYFWRGRVKVTNFERTREIGMFNLEVPMADPYKYDVLTSSDPWEWDSFDLCYGAIRYLGTLDIDNTEVIIDKGTMETVPVFEVDSIESATLAVAVNNQTYNLVVGRNRFPQIKVAGKEDVVLKFTGKGVGRVVYRSGSL